ncbi:MAG: hypothetical protein PVI99_06260 [Anaerolineales bacterium]
MTVRNLLTLNAALTALVALTALLSPATFLDLNGLEFSQTAINLERLFGAVSIGYAFISWMMRNQPASGARRAFLLGSGMAYIVIATVNVINILAMTNLETNIGWAIFGANALLGIVFLIFGTREPLLK